MEGPWKVSMPFRMARIGTMKVFKAETTLPMKLSSKRLKFSVKLKSDASAEVIEIYIPSKDIALVESFLGRGCSVVWIQTSRKRTKSIQQLLGMKKGKIPTPYYDPDSSLLEETYIGIVLDLDPIPYTESYAFKQVVSEIFKQREISGNTHSQMSPADCNARLFAISQSFGKLASLQEAAAGSKQNSGICIPEALRMSASLLPEKRHGTTSDDDDDDASSASSKRKRYKNASVRTGQGKQKRQVKRRPAEQNTHSQPTRTSRQRVGRTV